MINVDYVKKVVIASKKISQPSLIRRSLAQ